MALGPRIREERSRRGLTQRQLAAMIGMDFTYLSKIENGKLEHTPSIKMLQDLARVLELDELELLDLADKVPPVFGAVARDADARRFFRRASETISGPEGWRDLLRYLESREQHRGRDSTKR